MQSVFIPQSYERFGTIENKSQIRSSVFYLPEIKSANGKAKSEYAPGVYILFEEKILADDAGPL